jgi:hypothetical protein
MPILERASSAALGINDDAEMLESEPALVDDTALGKAGCVVKAMKAKMAAYQPTEANGRQFRADGKLISIEMPRQPGAKKS